MPRGIQVAEVGSLPEVMGPVFFYSPLDGLLWQGGILMKPLWKKIYMAQDAGSRT